MLTAQARSTIITLRLTGLPCTTISKQLGLSLGSVQQFVYRHGLSHKVVSVDNCGKRYDWDEVQGYYDANHSRKECLIKFDMSPTAWHMAIKSKKIRVRPKIDRTDFFSIRKIRNSVSLRHNLLKIGKLTGKCSVCSISSWQDKPITLHIDHINGDHADNHLQNLRELCPNCHSQTPTFCSKQRLKVKGTLTEAVIKQRHAEGASDLTIAREVGCSSATVASVARGWRRRYT
jgi:Zn finger protein HypA/HybF involved in hydrogenase expression